MLESIIILFSVLFNIFFVISCEVISKIICDISLSSIIPIMSSDLFKLIVAVINETVAISIEDIELMITSEFVTPVLSGVQKSAPSGQLE